ncbi:hypothetical protein QFC22_004866 [Naganishia vaughanmartiniae]|uniref:Uncharacterized protein n=1 Tax=Naganishia vaughanmartiniae TaxID=1424756 RepID=A0ACC2WXG9_9TREE|nr:hypothetical protein QFC22_004866 [Naganishia vaughanmartiniae]
MDPHNKSPSSHSHEEEEHHNHQQPHQNPEDDADLQSFIQSGMGITLPPLSMGMDTVADQESQHEHEGVAQDHTAAEFEVADFRELMTDGPGERREKVVSRQEEQEGSEHGAEREGIRGQKRTRESSAAGDAQTQRDDEERINVQQEIGNDDEDQARHSDKRLRTAAQSPDGTTLQDASTSMTLPPLTPQQETININSNDENHNHNTLEEMTPALHDVDHAQGQTQPGGKQETAEERKVRQREANRLAAGRSRGKKRDELYVDTGPLWIQSVSPLLHYGNPG